MQLNLPNFAYILSWSVGT